MILLRSIREKLFCDGKAMGIAGESSDKSLALLARFRIQHKPIMGREAGW